MLGRKSPITLKLMLVFVACVAVYVYAWKIATETDPSPRYIRDLKSGGAESRREAVIGLGDLGIQASPGALPALVDVLLKDEDVEVRIASAGAIGQMGRTSETAAAGLIAALKDGDARVRAGAASALGTQAWSPSAPGPLAEALSDPSPEVRVEAAMALAAFPSSGLKIKAGLFEARTDADPEVRAAVLGTIDSHAHRRRPFRPPDAKALAAMFQEAILRGLDDPSPRVRRAASRALRTRPAFGYADPAAVIAAETAALRDIDPETRVAAARALGNAIHLPISERGPNLDANLLGALVALLGSLGDDNVRSDAVAALRGIGDSSRWRGLARDPQHRGRLEIAFQTALTVEQASARAAAVSTIEPISRLVGAEAPSMTERFAAALGDPEPAVRRAGVEALARIGRVVVPDREALDACVHQFREAIECACWGEWPSARRYARLGVSGLPSILRDSDPTLARTFMGSEPALRLALDDRDPHVRRLAYTTLWRTGVPLRVGQESLRESLRATMKAYLADLDGVDPTSREVAAWALHWVDQDDARAAVVALERARGRGTPAARERIDAALKNLKNGLMDSNISGWRWLSPSWPSWNWDVP